MSDFQKWSVLAFRAMDDAGRVLMTIEPESTTEGERLDQLKETIRELLTQALLLNDVCTRRQLDERFQFGKLDTDAFNVQLGQQQAEPIGWLDGNDKLAEFMHRDLKAEHDKRGSATPREFTVPVYSALPQRKPLTDGLEIKVKRELFRFHSEQEWVNKAQSWYAKCGVRKGHYVTVDALGHVMHMGLCFRHATYPVTCYELQTNWPNESAAHGIKEPKS